MKDSLERLFYKYLKKENPEDADWNTPADEVWEKIDQALGAEEDRRKPLAWLWLLMALLFFILLGTMYRIHSLQKRVHKLETVSNAQTFQELNTTTSKSELAPEEVQKTDHARAREENDNKNFLMEGQDTQKSELLRKEKGRQVREKDRQAVAQSSDLGLVSETGQVPPSPALTSVSASASASAASSLALLPSLSFFAEAESTVLTDYIRAASLPQKEANASLSSAFFLSFYGGVSGSAAPVRGSMSGAFQSMQGSDQLMSSWHSGVELGRRLGRHWFALTGVSYRTIKVWSLTETSATFDASTETSTGTGSMKSVQHFSIPSSIGMLSSDMELLYAPSLGIEDGDMLSATMDVTRYLHALSMPVAVGYEHSLGSRLGFDVAGGLSWNKILHSRVKLKPEVKYQGVQMEVKTPQLPEASLPDYWSFFGRAALRYKLNPSYSIGLSLGYYRSIKPNFQLEDMHSRIHGFDLSARVYYQF